MAVEVVVDVVVVVCETCFHFIPDAVCVEYKGNKKTLLKPCVVPQKKKCFWIEDAKS